MDANYIEPYSITIFELNNKVLNIISLFSDLELSCSPISNCLLSFRKWTWAMFCPETMSIVICVISTTEKRVVTLNVKTYETTGSYVTIKLFKKKSWKHRIPSESKNNLNAIRTGTNFFTIWQNAWSNGSQNTNKFRGKGKSYEKKIGQKTTKKLSANKKHKAEPEDTDTEVEY